MRLTGVKIEGFGRLRDAEISFGPAMNRVVVVLPLVPVMLTIGIRPALPSGT